MQELIDKTRLLMLFDLYGDLLTEKSRKSFSLYLNEDWSLSEIAECEGISRQAVHASIQRTAESLEHMESRLSCFRDRMQLKHDIEEIQNLLEQKNIEDAEKKLAALQRNL